ncbi:MAG: hypothetical protein M3Z04_01655 [Chloroflexota bacterium]|nr:hypothetical protein [Chloroflexota bacterium]
MSYRAAQVDSDEASRAQQAATDPADRQYSGGPVTVPAHSLPAGRGNGAVRAATIQAMQQSVGNRAVQRWAQGAGLTSVQRAAQPAEAEEETATPAAKQSETVAQSEAKQPAPDHTQSPAMRALHLATLSPTQRASFSDQEADVAGAGKSEDETALPESIERAKQESKRKLVEALEAGSTPRGRQLLSEALTGIREYFRRSNFIPVAIWTLYSEGAPVGGLMRRLAGIPEGAPAPGTEPAGQAPPPVPVAKDAPDNPLMGVVGLLVDKVETDVRATIEAAWNAMGPALAGNPGVAQAVTSLVDRYISNPSQDSWWRPLLLDAAAH